uniref:Variant surface glycoprotein n=1 Tax=Trypanosoma brucei TaxID=5691 RepID=A0A1V0FXS4_9TRYP|nr:variant surface glycoprotein [Trypanosoma brucei]
MLQSVTLTLITMVAFAVKRQATAAAGEYKNQKHLHNLCQLVALTKASLENEDTAEISSAQLDELERINMSLAHPIFKEKLPTKAAEKKYGSAYCQPPGNKEECKENHGRWEDVFIAMHDNGKLKDIYKVKKEQLTSTSGRSAAMQIQLLLKKAEQIREEYNTGSLAALTSPSKTVTQLIHEAIYGKAAQTDLTKDTCEVTLTSGRGDDCNGDVGRTAVCATLMCLCAKEGAQDKELCGSAASSNAGGSWGQAQRASIWNNIKSVCKAYQAPAVTPVKIRALIQNALAAVTTVENGGGDHLVLGKAHTDGTCSTRSDVGCIQLSDTRTLSTAPPAKSLTWVDLLERAADRLQANLERNKARTVAINAIQRLTKEGQHLMEVLKNSVTETQVASPSIGHDHRRNAEEIKKCTKLITNSTCRDAGCKWEGKNETDGKCTADDSKVKEHATQAGTGEGAAGTTAAASAGCASHKSKPDCENDKKDDKQNCAWRKGKDNEDDKDTEKCRSSSFLLNKQFALSVVSAAFVALLF